jgi:hypothetical protein
MSKRNILFDGYWFEKKYVSVYKRLHTEVVIGSIAYIIKDMIPNNCIVYSLPLDGVNKMSRGSV